MIRRKIRRARLRIDSLLSRILPHALVLIYHRVNRLDSDPQRLSVTPENFDTQMELLSRKFNPVSLRELMDGLSHGRVRDRAVVVTFDDGYEDNYLNARPILEKHSLPATIYVASGYSGTNREFWWDELERLLLTKDTLPEEISINLGGDLYRGPANEQCCASPHEIYTELCARFQTLDSGQLDRALTQLRELTGDDGTARADYRPMNIEQLRSLYTGGLIEIGAHTRSHANLAAQSVEQQSDEIQGSKLDLEKMLGGNVESFSYPFGTIDHYSKWSVKCVRDAGFHNALSNFTGCVSRISNRYEIPRCLVRDWDKETFAGAMDRYYSGQRQVDVHGR